MTMKHFHCETSRRNFLRRAASQFLGVSFLSSWPNTEGCAAEEIKVLPARGTARRLIYLYLSGGLSHLDTFDAKANREVMGPVAPRPTDVPGLTFTQNVPLLAERVEHLSVIHSMQSTQGAHPQGNYYMHTSYTPENSITHPAMGGWLANQRSGENPTLPNNVLISPASRHPGAGFLESRFSPLTMTDPAGGLRNSKSTIDEVAFTRERQMSEELDAMFTARYNQKNVRAYNDMYRDAVRLMDSSDVVAFDLSNEPSSTRARYGSDLFGQGCLVARRLAERDVAFVEVNDTGWDTHTQNFPRVKARGRILDQAMSALIDDLSTSGILDETLVVLATEFGRTPEINVNDGRDHNPTAFTCMLAGGGVVGGRVHGRSDDRGACVDESPVTIPDFNATIAYALGLPLERKFESPSKRSFQIADNGEPVLSLFS
ncbi:MAG: DUF1501 domain-containing protein [Fuerstiella sp.]|nr:DUF1501 domain-containing protein [Fuerstiella sp.]MCP4857621.1 DUF1501 domain-containing protein [Fuerstiella sp.]